MYLYTGIMAKKTALVKTVRELKIKKKFSKLRKLTQNRPKEVKTNVKKVIL